MAWWAGRGKPPLASRDWAGVIGLGFTGYYLSSFLDFIGLQYITASLERIGPALTAQTGMVGPLSTILLGVLLLGEPFTTTLAAGTALVIAGIFVFTRA